MLSPAGDAMCSQPALLAKVMALFVASPAHLFRMVKNFETSGHYLGIDLHLQSFFWAVYVRCTCLRFAVAVSSKLTFPVGATGVAILSRATIIARLRTLPDLVSVKEEELYNLLAFLERFDFCYKLNEKEIAVRYLYEQCLIHQIEIEVEILCNLNLALDVWTRWLYVPITATNW